MAHFANNPIGRWEKDKNRNSTGKINRWQKAHQLRFNIIRHWGNGTPGHTYEEQALVNQRLVRMHTSWITYPLLVEM